MPTKTKSRTKSSKNTQLAPRWWMIAIAVFVIAVVGIAVVRFSFASSNVDNSTDITKEVVVTNQPNGTSSVTTSTTATTNQSIPTSVLYFDTPSINNFCSVNPDEPNCALDPSTHYLQGAPCQSDNARIVFKTINTAVGCKATPGETLTSYSPTVFGRFSAGQKMLLCVSADSSDRTKPVVVTDGSGNVLTNLVYLRADELGHYTACGIAIIPTNQTNGIDAVNLSSSATFTLYRVATALVP